MNKSKLRKKTIEYLNTISFTEKQNIEQKLVHNLLNTPLWKNANVVGITVSQKYEWDTRMLIETAWKQGKQIVIPKCYPNEKEMMFYSFLSYSDLENVYMDLWEPKVTRLKKLVKKDIDLLVVPGLLFDRLGYRIGFGGGYYDRFLQSFPNITVSLTSDRQILTNLPHESFDIPVDYIITENGFVK